MLKFQSVDTVVDMSGAPLLDNRRTSLQHIPGHHYDAVRYLQAEVSSALKYSVSHSQLDEGLKVRLDSLYDDSIVSQRPGIPKPTVIRQSPIDIRVRDTVYDSALEFNPLTINYPLHVKDFCRLRNTGYTWKLTIGDSRFGIDGGPVHGRYQLDQVHAHWGPDNIAGSEHMVDRYSYAGELHFVHWNTGKCKTIDTAATEPDGLAVIGVFLKIGEANPELEKLTEAMQDIHYAEQEIPLDNADVNLSKLMPTDTSQYWTYDGSLTTTPYDDCVIWIVMKNPIEISKKQMDAMRSLVRYEEGQHNSHDNCANLVHNFRPVQDQSRVKVRSSFKPVVDYL